MKLIKIYKMPVVLPFVLMVLISIPACKKSFLEINPKGKLIAETVEDYDLLLNNNDFLNTGGANAQVFMSDEVAAAEPYFTSAEPRTQRLFKWEPLVYEPDEDAAETSSLLKQLYAYNKIITEVPEALGGTEQQKRSIQAEARAGRAWVNFMLINYFAKPYHEESAATDPGFPIITAADVTANSFSRASVKEVYDFIVDDLVNSVADLPVKTVYRIRMSRPAAEALLGKVYMFMGKYEEALPLLTNALEGVQNAEIPIELIDYNTAFEDGGLFTPVDFFFGPNVPTINEDPQTIYARQFSNFWITTSELVLSSSTVALFGSSDLRLNFFSNMPFPFGDPYQAGLLRRMAPLTASYGVVLPDVILLRAECRARLADMNGCIDDLEFLRSRRMAAADAAVPGSVSGDQQLLLEYVFNERIREFASLGMRWFDMRRLSVDPLFGDTNFKHLIYGIDGTSQEITLPSERLLLKIPRKILAENPGMQDNP